MGLWSPQLVVRLYRHIVNNSGYHLLCWYCLLEIWVECYTMGWMELLSQHQLCCWNCHSCDWRMRGSMWFIVDIWDSLVILPISELFSASCYYEKWPNYKITWFYNQTHTLDMSYVLQRLWSLQWSSSSFQIVEVFELYNSSILVCSCESNLYI